MAVKREAYWGNGFVSFRGIFITFWSGKKWDPSIFFKQLFSGAYIGNYGDLKAYLTKFPEYYMIEYIWKIFGFKSLLILVL